MSLEENAKMLTDLGLTYNQAKVYIATVELSLASVGKISKVSKVRREEVYRLLPKLEKRGLIEKVLGTPTKIRATPVEDALSILIKAEKDRATKKLSALMTKKEEFLRHFKANRKKMKLEEEETQFTLISEKEGILTRSIIMLKNAEKEIDAIYSRNNLARFISANTEQLRKAVRKGVKIRVITEVPEDEDSIPIMIEKHISPEVSFGLKYTDSIANHFMIVDGKEALVATSTDMPVGENPSLWTNNSGLVGIMQRNFEDMWHASVNWTEVKPDPSEKLKRFVSQLRPAEHAIFVYNFLETKYNVLFNYIKCGLENGEAAIYICSEEDPNQIKEAMKRLGIEVEEYKKTGALSILNYNDVYIMDGKFSIQHTVSSWEKFYRETLAKGFKGLRVTGETTWFFKHGLTRELIEYEKALHRVFDIPMVAICAYNANMLTKTEDPINVYSELVKAHGTVLFTGTDKKLGRIEIRKA